TTTVPGSLASTLRPYTTLFRSHTAGSTSGALPMGARLRLKAGVDVTQRTTDPHMQKILRAMQKYGLLVADNGSDMYITGTHDTRSEEHTSELQSPAHHVCWLLL